jgi:hypothetical protein
MDMGRQILFVDRRALIAMRRPKDARHHAKNAIGDGK